VQADVGHVVHAGAIAGAAHNKLSVRAGFSY
jgi:hypothetical protein